MLSVEILIVLRIQLNAEHKSKFIIRNMLKIYAAQPQGESNFTVL